MLDPQWDGSSVKAKKRFISSMLGGRSGWQPDLDDMVIDTLQDQQDTMRGARANRCSRPLRASQETSQGTPAASTVFLLHLCPVSNVLC